MHASARGARHASQLFSAGAQGGMLQLLFVAVVAVCLLGMADASAVPSYLVIGQQKCGTSTLWALMNDHPRLRAGSKGGGGKEPRFFQQLHTYNYGIMYDRCDRNLGHYYSLWKDLPEGGLAGDFTPAQISCYCCPEMYHDMAPGIKLIALLRDPVERTLSRFTEQWNWPFPMKGPLQLIVQRYDNLGQYAIDEIKALQECIDTQNEIPPSDNIEYLKWLTAYRCLQRSNSIGWSAYSVFLKRWLELFPKEQLLVLYTSELESQAEATMRKVERHLGIEPHTYEPTLLAAKFNTAKKYGWGTAIIEDDSGGGSDNGVPKERTFQVRSGQGYGVNMTGSVPKEELKGDVKIVYDFLKPYMAELKQMADEGVISQPPPGFMDPYL